MENTTLTQVIVNTQDIELHLEACRAHHYRLDTVDGGLLVVKFFDENDQLADVVDACSFVSFLGAQQPQGLATHILAMADDAYLTGHPEWNAIVEEARRAA